MAQDTVKPKKRGSTLSVFEFAEPMNKRQENIIAEPRIAETDTSNHYAVEKYPEHTMPVHQRHVHRRTDSYRYTND